MCSLPYGLQQDAIYNYDDRYNCHSVFHVEWYLMMVLFSMVWGTHAQLSVLILDNATIAVRSAVITRNQHHSIKKIISSEDGDL